MFHPAFDFSQRIFVADWNSDDLAEMFTLRAMLEAHAAGRAATGVGSNGWCGDCS
jgi:DNA-binding GntR family transcriptional regulator